MSTENLNPKVDENTVPWFPTALRYGLYAALISVIFSLFAYLFDFAIPTNLSQIFIQLLFGLSVTIVILVLAIKYHRDKELGGLISFKRAFLVGWVALVISGIISTIFQMLYINVIDPDFVDIALEKVSELLEGLGLDEDEIERQMKENEERFTISGMLMQAFVWTPLITAIFAAITAAIMKKKDPF